MTHEEMIENGQRLFQSAENLRKSAPDLDALLESLWDTLVDKRFFGDVRDIGDEDPGGKGVWLSCGYAFNAGVLSRPKRLPGQKGPSRKPKQIGTVSIIARLCNSDNIEDDIPNWPWLNQACLIMGWHPKAHSEDNWEIENFDPNEDSISCIKYVGDGLWVWDEDHQDYAYFFALPLYALRNEMDVKRYALHPLKTLFESKAPKSEAKCTLDKIPVLMPSQ